MRKMPNAPAICVNKQHGEVRLHCREPERSMGGLYSRSVLFTLHAPFLFLFRGVLSQSVQKKAFLTKKIDISERRLYLLHSSLVYSCSIGWYRSVVLFVASKAVFLPPRCLPFSVHRSSASVAVVEKSKQRRPPSLLPSEVFRFSSKAD